MIEALTDKIIVEEMRRVESDGGIIIPEMVGEPQCYGKVLSVGPDVGESIKLGDVLVFHPRGGMAVLMEKKILKVVKEDEVYGKLAPEFCKNLVTMEIGAVSEGEQLVKPAGGGRIVRPS
jgi:co-chaperonin GroES (HSP10)